jgi:hypothetical protein
MLKITLLMCGLIENEKTEITRLRELTKKRAKKYIAKHKAECQSRAKAYKLKNRDKTKNTIQNYNKQKHIKTRHVQVVAKYKERPDYKDRLSKRTRLHKVKHINKGAIKRGICVEMTDFEMLTYVYSECCYCGIKDEEILNGIDRIDNFRGYTLENCVPACKTCNYMKHAYTLRDFLRSIINIVNFHEQVPDPKLFNYDFDHKMSGSLYTIYKANAKRSKLTFELTKEQFVALVKQPCSYCGNSKPGRTGVDRVDNKQGYVISNVNPCCSICNRMKKTMTVEYFIEHCRNIIKHVQIDDNGRLQNKLILRSISETSIASGCRPPLLKPQRHPTQKQNQKRNGASQ